MRGMIWPRSCLGRWRRRFCGAKTCVDIADFAASREEELSQIVDLPHGAPSHDTFSRVFRLLDPAQPETAFSRCMAALRQALGIGGPKGVVAIDDKALRRGYDPAVARAQPRQAGPSRSRPSKITCTGPWTWSSMKTTPDPAKSRSRKPRRRQTTGAGHAQLPLRHQVHLTQDEDRLWRQAFFFELFAHMR
jgi:hypothetical protein